VKNKIAENIYNKHYPDPLGKKKSTIEKRDFKIEPAKNTDPFQYKRKAGAYK